MSGSRFRIWLGCAAVGAIVVASVIAAVLVLLSDNDKPTLALPLAIATAGTLLAALIGALLLLWGRSERIARGIAARRIGERDRAEAERQRTERRYRVLAENSIDMIGVSDLEGRLVYVSPSSLTLFGFRPEEMIGRSSFDFIHPDDLESARSMIGTLLEEPRSVTYQCRFLRKDGSYVWIEAAARSITDPVSGEISELQAAIRDISDRKRLHQELERLAQQDSLTGLGNRRRFEQEVEAEMARSRRQLTPGALLLIDVDHFKSVNDSLGHLAGDKVLKQIAEVLGDRLRESDSLARLGGDEFAILLPDTGLREARLVAESLTRAIREGTEARRGGGGDREHRRRPLRRGPAARRAHGDRRGGPGDVRGQGRRPRPGTRLRHRPRRLGAPRPQDAE